MGTDWEKITYANNILNEAQKGDFLRFVGDSGDLIGDINIYYVILAVYGEQVEYMQIATTIVRIANFRKFETGNWYIKSSSF